MAKGERESAPEGRKERKRGKASQDRGHHVVLPRMNRLRVSRRSGEAAWRPSPEKESPEPGGDLPPRRAPGRGSSAQRTAIGEPCEPVPPRIGDGE